MTDMEIYSNNIKKGAEELLKSTNLIKVLSEFGEVYICGSYKYDLMWGFDIDVMVICNNPREMSIKALQKIINLRLFQKYEYGDFVKFKRKNRPESYIVNALSPFNGQKWEIETWFFEKYPDNVKEIDELIANKLNENNKKIILDLKKKRDEDKVSKHKISSTEIYRKVLGN